MLLPLILLLAMEFEVMLLSLTEVSSRCGEDVVLMCEANIDVNKYLSITWYKGNKEGIIRKNLPDKLSWYDFGRNVSLNNDNSLQLAKVTPDDSGRYECMVSARVGFQNLKLPVQLTVQDCEPDVTTEGPHGPEGPQAPHLPLVWSLVGYGAVAFTKITLSIMIIWIFHICSRRKRRLGR
ncbi:unnamed protein product [Knipowitschia caucasica]|uniref:Ig-like domain-containing protein n=1 Tax=Knipowitschia caucasica TaxID=637954 RepID=A0AAV2LZH8_KNICA